MRTIIQLVNQELRFTHSLFSHITVYFFSSGEKIGTLLYNKLYYTIILFGIPTRLLSYKINTFQNYIPQLKQIILQLRTRSQYLFFQYLVT